MDPFCLLFRPLPLAQYQLKYRVVFLYNIQVMVYSHWLSPGQEQGPEPEQWGQRVSAPVLAQM